MRSLSWRTVDILVVAAIAVVFGVVFWAWNILWGAAEPAFLAMPPARNVLYGVWLIPAVLAAFVVRKPGAALFAELVASSISALIGSQWGIDTVVSGAMQGLGAELVFALTRYQHWNAVTAVVAALGAAVAAWIHDMVVYYYSLTLGDQLVIGVFMAISAVILTGIGSLALFGALTRAGVLAPFAAGRAQPRV